MQAIESEPNLLVFKNEHARLVDNLAYVDPQIAPEALLAVKDAIARVSATLTKKDYLADFPEPTEFMLPKSEVDRLKSGKQTRLNFVSLNQINTLQDR